MERLAYDGTPEGFFTCLAVLFPPPGAEGLLPKDASREAVILHPPRFSSPGRPSGSAPPAGLGRPAAWERSADPDLFDRTRTVTTDPEAAMRFRERAVSLWGRESLRCIEYGFRSGESDRETLLLDFVRALAAGKDAKDIADRRVLALRKRLGRISHEVLRMQGFLRFREVPGGGLFAEIEPDNDVLDLVVPHFARRFPRDPFVILDLRRGKAAVRNGKTVEFTEYPSTEFESVRLSAAGDEKAVENLWRLYFQTIEIRERGNPALQDRLLPRRYRKHLPEFDDGGPP